MLKKRKNRFKNMFEIGRERERITLCYFSVLCFLLLLLLENENDNIMIIDFLAVTKEIFCKSVFLHGLLSLRFVSLTFFLLLKSLWYFFSCFYSEFLFLKMVGFVLLLFFHCFTILLIIFYAYFCFRTACYWLLLVFAFPSSLLWGFFFCLNKFCL